MYLNHIINNDVLYSQILKSLGYVIMNKNKIIGLSRVGTEVPAFSECNLVVSENSVNDDQVKRSMMLLCHLP